MLSQRTRSQVAELRKDFVGFSAGLDALAKRRADLAPRFMATYRRYHRETRHSFVSFVQLVDPGLPAKKAKYENHPSYLAARYLRRVVEAPHTLSGRTKGRPPMDVCAMLWRAVLANWPGRADQLWHALEQSTQWRAGEIDRFRKRVRRARQFPLPGVPRLVPAKIKKIA